MSWAVPLAVVAFSPLRIKAIVLRCAVLAVTVVLLAVSGPLLYAYTLTQSTARVFFSEAAERTFSFGYGSILFISPNAKYFYGLCILGWAIGLVLARGRVRVLVAAGAAAFGFYLLYLMAYLLLDVIWWLPIPFNIEHSLAYLFMASAVAGYWSGLQSIAAFARPSAGLGLARRRHRPASSLARLGGFSCRAGCRRAGAGGWPAVRARALEIHSRRRLYDVRAART